MQLKHVKCSLPGYGQARYPRAGAKLNDFEMEFAKSGMNTKTADLFEHKAFTDLPGYISRGRCTTSDGYIWPIGVFFNVGDGTAVVLFPERSYLESTDSIKQERAVAIFKSGGVTASEIRDLINLLVETRDQLYKTLVRKEILHLKGLDKDENLGRIS